MSTCPKLEMPSERHQTPSHSAQRIDRLHVSEAELEVQQKRMEMTHLSRLAMLGELSGALAHELNQPLTTILSNAQAGLRILAQDKVDLNGLRELLKLQVRSLPELVRLADRAGIRRPACGVSDHEVLNQGPVALTGL